MKQSSTFSFLVIDFDAVEKTHFLITLHNGGMIDLKVKVKTISLSSTYHNNFVS